MNNTTGSRQFRHDDMHGSSGIVPTIEFEEETLHNGMRVILRRDTRAPLVHVLVWYYVGSRNETPELTGFAHLFEHMMFQGSENVGKTEHFTLVQGVGGTLNASTGQERTNYFQTLPREYLRLGLWLEADRMRSLRVTQENYDNQRAVVREERMQRYDNAPYGLWYLTMLEMLFSGTSYGWGPIGDMEQLDAASLDAVQDFHKRYYVPNNATLVVVGDFDADEARQAIAEYFTPIPSGAQIPPVEFDLAPITEQRRRVIRSRVPLPAVYIGFQGPPLSHPDARALDILAFILDGGRSSRLQQKLVYASQIAQEVSCSFLDNQGCGILVALGIAAEGVPIEHVEKGLFDSIESIVRDGVNSREMETAINTIQTWCVTSLTRLQGVADSLARNSVFRGDASLINNTLGEYAAVTADDIQRVALKWLRPDSACVLQYLPENASAPLTEISQTKE